MTRRETTGADSAAAEAARWFVRLDGGERVDDAELARWLAHPENEQALERVELAAALGKRLAADPTSALYARAAEAARAEPRRTMGRALAWGSASAAALLVAILVAPDSSPPDDPPALVPLRAAELVRVAAPNEAAAVLPTGAVVDASAVAVLPFAASGDATLAAQLERGVTAALRSVPGLYVIADDAVRPYAATELGVADLGGQLGARGIVDASVEAASGRIRVSARLRDAATGATLWRLEADRSADELSAIRAEIAENVATMMFDSDLRERAARAGRPRAPVSVGKPLPQ